MVLPLDMCVGIAFAKIRNKLVVVRKVLIEFSCPVRNCATYQESTCWCGVLLSVDMRIKYARLERVYFIAEGNNIYHSCTFEILGELERSSAMVPMSARPMRVTTKICVSVARLQHLVFMRRIRPTMSVVETPSVRGMDLNFPDRFKFFRAMKTSTKCFCFDATNFHID